MPIPGDNGDPKLERKQQNDRIRDVALTGANVAKDINQWNAPAKTEAIHFDGAIYKRG